MADNQRAGISWVGISAVLVVLAALGIAAYKVIPSVASPSAETDALTHMVKQGEFNYVLTERGEIEASNNDEIRCKVRSQNMNGTSIITVVDEGTLVKKGDELLKFDSANLETEIQKQQIACNASAAKMAKAENTLKTAKMSLREYAEGMFVQEEQTIQAEVFNKESEFGLAQKRLQHLERMAGKGFANTSDLDAAKLSVKKAETELAAAHTKLRVLRDFTKEKKVLELQSAIDTATSELESERSNHELENGKLNELKDQLDLCTVKAPNDGQVVYAPPFWNGDQQVRIGVGAQLREGQLIMTLPDFSKMQVKTTVHEARVHHVKVGMMAQIRLEALPDLGDIDCEVIKVDEYPDQGGFWMSARVYAVRVEVRDAPKGLRPGMTSEVKIFVDKRPDVLTVPVQSVARRAGKYYCAVQTATGWIRREVEVSLNNGEFVIVTKGLEPGEKVALSLQELAEEIDLPKDAAVEQG